MEIRVLNYFVETANQNSMTKAARKIACNTTHSLKTT